MGFAIVAACCANSNQPEDIVGNIGFTQIAVVVLLIVIFFGRGKISEVMGDVAKGIKNFRQGLTDDEEQASGDATLLEQDDSANKTGYDPATAERQKDS